VKDQKTQDERVAQRARHSGMCRTTARVKLGERNQLPVETEVAGRASGGPVVDDSSVSSTGHFPC